MVNFSNNTFSTLKKLVNQKLFKKILIISGKKSYFASGAEKLIKKILKDKETYLLLKKNKYPEIKELKRIILYTQSGNLYLVINSSSGSLTTLGNYLANNTWGWMAITRDSSRNSRNILDGVYLHH